MAGKNELGKQLQLLRRQILTSTGAANGVDLSN